MRFFKYFSIIIFLVIVALIWDNKQSDIYQLQGKIFGTYYNIKIRNPHKTADLQAIIDKQFSLINLQMSVFNKDSEINKLNNAKKNEKIATSPELISIIQTSKEISKQTQNAFDITIGELVNLWGFGPDNQKHIPSKKQIESKLKHTGSNKIIIFAPQYVYKTDTDTKINLSAIAKGYAVDLIAQTLKKEGFSDFLVDIGGEVYAAGNRNIQEQGWNIGIAEPSPNGHKNLMTMRIKDLSIATSGNYNNFYYDNEGKKIAHTIDPKTGYPVEHNLVSATVLHTSCMYADAYATALMVMGEKKGLEFANKHNLVAIMFTKDIYGKINTIYSQQGKLLTGVENE